MRTVDQGRAVKIENFSKNLTFDRVERNIRSLFVSKKAKYMLEKMKSFSLFRYWTFIFCMKKYIRNFKKRKYNKCRGYAITVLTKNSIRQKIEIGMLSLRKKAGKIRKLKDWMEIY